MENKDYLDPILVVDDEHNNVVLLLEALREIGHKAYQDLKLGPKTETNGIGHLKYTFVHEVSCPGEAIALMKEFQEEKIRFGAIISDNHMKGEEGEAISGDDFLRVICGQPAYCISKDESDLDIDYTKFRDVEDLANYIGKKEEEFTDFFSDHFEDMPEYERFVDYWNPVKNGKPSLVMLCGSPREVKTEGLDDLVPIVQKTWNKDDKTCERHVLDILLNQRVLPWEQTIRAIDKFTRLRTNAPERKRYYKPPRA